MTFEPIERNGREESNTEQRSGGDTTADIGVVVGRLQEEVRALREELRNVKQELPEGDQPTAEEVELLSDQIGGVEERQGAVMDALETIDEQTESITLQMVESPYMMEADEEYDRPTPVGSSDE